MSFNCIHMKTSWKSKKKTSFHLKMKIIFMVDETLK